MRTRMAIAVGMVAGIAGVAAVQTPGHAQASRPVTPKPAPPKAAAPPPATAVAMATLAGGTFTMGDRHDTVTVAAFSLDVTEVTAAAWAACVASGACPAQRWTTEMGWPHLCTYGFGADEVSTGMETHPINCVDWGHAATYCHAQGKRLPTEAEWEWAARGGTEGRTYPWGSAAPDFQPCWSGIAERPKTCAVGSNPSGDAPGGIHDLAGNVSEWTSTTTPTGEHIKRGGSFQAESKDVDHLRAAARWYESPEHGTVQTGFRCAR